MRTSAEINADSQALDERAEAIKSELRQLHEMAGEKALTPGQEQRWERLQAGLDKIMDRKRELLRELAQNPKNLTSGDGATGGVPTPASVTGSTFGRARQVIDTAARNGQLPDHAAQKATLLVDQGDEHSRGLAARWAAATGSAEYLSAFGKLMADPTRGHLMWDAAEQRAFADVARVQSEFRAMSIGSGGTGGYMVPLTLDPAILLTNDGSVNPLRRIARVVQTTTNAWQGVTSAGATAEWKAEAAEVADGSPTLDAPSIPVHFGDSFVPYSFEVGMDASNLLGELQRVLVDAADQLMADAYTNGTGTGQPTGIITALAGTASEVPAATAETFTEQDVYAVQAALGPRFQPRAQWCAEISTYHAMAQMETSNGARVFPELNNDRLLRKPFNELSNMDGWSGVDPTVTGDNRILLYGDFQHFVIVDRIGTQLELIPNLMGANNRPTGQRGALLWFRTGSDVVVPEAFRVLNVATSV